MRNQWNSGTAYSVVVMCLSLALAVQPARAQHGDHHDDVEEQTEEVDHHTDDGDGQRDEVDHDDEAHEMPSEGHDPEMHEDQRDHPMHRVEMEHPEMEMESILQPGDPATRDGSGTSWLPDGSPMHAVHQTSGEWHLMLHGVAFLRYNWQDAFGAGERGDHQLDVPNWIMGMAHRRLSMSNQIGFRAMLSLDPLIVGGRGYPLLFQTGETYEGEPLIDRQHPHDLFSELAIVYGQDLGEEWGIFGYFGYPGEPALGPPVYLHRPSAIHLPDAPLGHHWQDATHIVFGVATLGVRYGGLKVDGSIFTGAEPDEERFGFDPPLFNSYSGRLAYNPNERWALQISRGFLKEPEALHPGQDQWRTSASATFVGPSPVRFGTWATTAVWGLNERVESELHDGSSDRLPLLHSFLIESALQVGRHAFYGRAEWVQKPAEELGLTEFDHDRTFDIRALSLGTSRGIAQLGDMHVDLGGHVTYYPVTSSLRPIYGDNPVSLQVYLRLSPPPMAMHRGHPGHH